MNNYSVKDLNKGEKTKSYLHTKLDPEAKEREHKVMYVDYGKTLATCIITIKCHCGCIFNTTLKNYFGCTSGCPLCTRSGKKYHILKIKEKEEKEAIKSAAESHLTPEMKGPFTHRVKKYEIMDFFKEKPFSTIADAIKYFGIQRRTMLTLLGPDFQNVGKQNKTFYNLETGKRVYLIQTRTRQLSNMKTILNNYKAPWGCQHCGTSKWLGADLSVFSVNDHVNGDHKDNSKNNLRVICSNCDSLTKTRYPSIDNDSNLENVNKANFITSQEQLLSNNSNRERKTADKLETIKLSKLNQKKYVGKLPNENVAGVSMPCFKENLIRSGIKEPKCARCGLIQWQGIDFSLICHIHHKNHDNTDQRVDNVDLLCPNCHRLEHNVDFTSLKKSELKQHHNMDDSNAPIPKDLMLRANYSSDNVRVQAVKAILKDRKPDESLKKLAKNNGIGYKTFRAIILKFNLAGGEPARTGRKKTKIKS